MGAIAGYITSDVVSGDSSDSGSLFDTFNNAVDSAENDAQTVASGAAVAFALVGAGVFIWLYHETKKH